MIAKWYLHAGKELMYLEKGYYFFLSSEESQTE